MNQKTTESSAQRIVPIWQLVMVAVVYSLLAWFNVEFVFKLVNDWVDRVPALALIGSYLPHFLGIVVCVVGLMLGLGRLTLRDLGLKFEQLWIGVLIVVLFWLSTEVYQMIESIRVTGTWNYRSGLTTGNFIKSVVNLLVTQIVGNALLEEVVFRGYFLQQIAAHVSERFQKRIQLGKVIGILIAIPLSVFLFTIIHLPIRLDRGVEGAELIASLMRLALWGTVFSLVFLTTRNLWATIGIHALTNRPCSFVEPIEFTRNIQLQICLLMIIAMTMVWLLRWSWKKRRDDGEIAQSP